ncbi:MAG TPA: hypothetical protein VHP33_25450 [Polyangiaceae bacterium]|nr:hypothetical protein [Polyangiaceae bacterium]
MLPLHVHSLPGCDLPPELLQSNLELLALGDFVASNDSAEFLRLDQAGAALKFPVATQAAVAHVGQGSQSFAGYAERHENSLDVLLWPELSTCQVWRHEGEPGYPGRNGGQAFAYSAHSGVVLAGGGNDPLDTGSTVGALSFDTRRGALHTLGTADEGVLRQPRAFATATPFGEQFLVAGGEEPVLDVPDRDLETLGTAELFDPKLGRFAGEPITLRSNRTHHAAVELRDGRTLLVGGRSQVGATSIAQYRLEIVDPASRRASVADAIAARIDPRAVRLSDGRIFIGGGVDLSGAPVEPVGQWLTVDARLETTRLSSDVAPRFERAFVPMLGGGLLAVGGCEDRPKASAEDVEACAACSRGCPPLGGEYDAWWIQSDGSASEVSLAGIHAPRPILLPGSNGSPWLVASAASAPEIPRLFRFDAWAERFELADVPDTLRLPRPGMPQPLALDPDAFVWLDDDGDRGELLGLRLGTRNRFTQDLALVLLSDPIETRPQHLVPDGPANGAVSYDGRLTLRSPEVSVRVADTDFADLTLQLRLVQGPPPVVVLGDTPLGGADCPWPEGDARGGDADLPTIVRKNGRAQLRFHGEGQSCAVAEGRVTLALRAGDDVTVVRQLDVTRSAVLR